MNAVRRTPTPALPTPTEVPGSSVSAGTGPGTVVPATDRAQHGDGTPVPPC